MYQKKIAELTIINDLLKKYPTAEVLARESELTGLIRTTRKSAQKKAIKEIGISMSTYYSDDKISRSSKEEEDANIRGKIEQIRVKVPRAGYRRLLHHLKRYGVKV